VFETLFVPTCPVGMVLRRKCFVLLFHRSPGRALLNEKHPACPPSPLLGIRPLVVLWGRLSLLLPWWRCSRRTCYAVPHLNNAQKTDCCSVCAFNESVAKTNRATTTKTRVDCVARTRPYRESVFVLRNSTRQLRRCARNPFNDTVCGDASEPRLELRPNCLVAGTHEGLRIESSFEDVVN